MHVLHIWYFLNFTTHFLSISSSGNSTDFFTTVSSSSPVKSSSLKLARIASYPQSSFLEYQARKYLNLSPVEGMSQEDQSGAGLPFSESNNKIEDFLHNLDRELLNDCKMLFII